MGRFTATAAASIIVLTLGVSVHAHGGGEPSAPAAEAPVEAFGVTGGLGPHALAHAPISVDQLGPQHIAAKPIARTRGDWGVWFVSALSVAGTYVLHRRCVA